jgi:hypothetical protein
MSFVVARVRLARPRAGSGRFALLLSHQAGEVELRCRAWTAEQEALRVGAAGRAPPSTSRRRPRAGPDVPPEFPLC